MIYLHMFLVAISITLGVLFPLACFVFIVSNIVRKRMKQMTKSINEATGLFLKAKLGMEQTGVKN